MSNYSIRQIFIGIIASTLLSSVMAFEKKSFYLLDSNGNPVLTTRQHECVQTPNTSHTRTERFEICGEIVEVEKDIDLDNDGIPDDEDQCPQNTPEQLVNGVFQSGVQKGCSIDSDRDTVADYLDSCPNNTSREINNGVDSTGCPVDLDQDSVLDYKDLCLNTPFGVAVDETGCPPVTAILSKAPVYKSACEANACRPLVVLRDLHFAFNSSELTPQAYVILENIINNANVANQIMILGHTDSMGREIYNQDLSEKRAKSVANFFIKQGISLEKITIEGQGEDNPISSNRTSSGRAENRRVEIHLSSSPMTE